MSAASREMTNIEIANKIAKDLFEADALGVGAWKIKIISALKDKDFKITRLEHELMEARLKTEKYERQLGL